MLTHWGDGAPQSTHLLLSFCFWISRSFDRVSGSTSHSFDMLGSLMGGRNGARGSGCRLESLAIAFSSIQNRLRKEEERSCSPDDQQEFIESHLNGGQRACETRNIPSRLRPAEMQDRQHGGQKCLGLRLPPAQKYQKQVSYLF